MDRFYFIYSIKQQNNISTFLFRGFFDIDYLFFIFKYLITILFDWLRAIFHWTNTTRPQNRKFHEPRVYYIYKIYSLLKCYNYSESFPESTKKVSPTYVYMGTTCGWRLRCIFFLHRNHHSAISPEQATSHLITNR